MKQTTYPAKISIPCAAKIFLRSNLFKMFIDPSYPIIWISSPAGSGKTSLATSFIRENKLPCLWYQLDQGDDDLASFFYYLGLAVKKSFPRKKKKLPILTPEYQPGILNFTRRYFRDLYTFLKTPAYIVFDNYQEIPEQSQLHEIIQEGLKELPDGIRVIFISRKSPPKEASRLYAENKIKNITWDDIKFSLLETEKIFKFSGIENIKKECIESIHKKIDGWIAGIILIQERIRKLNTEEQFSGKSPSRLKCKAAGDFSTEAYLPSTVEEKNRRERSNSGWIGDLDEITKDTPIFDYFLAEVFNKMDKEMQEFLIKTSFLNNITPDIAEKLTGIKESGKILQDLSNNNFFTRKKEDGYEYHALFREFLITKARKTLTFKEQEDLQLKAGKLLAEKGQIEDAVYLLANTKDWEGIIGIIMQYAQTLMSQGRIKSLLSWLEIIPKDLIENSAWLLYWNGAAKLAFNPTESIVLFDKSFKKFESVNDKFGMILSISGVVNAITVEHTDFKQFDKWIDIYSNLQKNEPVLFPNDLEEQIVSTFFSALSMREPDHSIFNILLKQAYQIFNNTANNNMKLHIGSNLLMHYTWTGNYPDAEMIINSLEKIIHIKDLSSMNLILFYFAKSQYYSFICSFKNSLNIAKEGLKISYENNIHFLTIPLLFICTQGVSKDFEQIDDKCKKYLEKIVITNNNMELSVYYQSYGWLKFLEGKISEAENYFFRMLQVSLEMGYIIPNILAHINLALVLHEKGEKEAAHIHLNEAYKIIFRMKSKILEFTYNLIKAYFNLEEEKKNKGLNFLRKAIEIGKENEYFYYPFCWYPKMMTRLCVIALENNIEPEYTQMLIRKRNLIPENPPIEIENWPWQIKIYTFGRFGILIDDKPLQFSGKAPAKPLEMLKCLIAFGGRGVNKQKISDALWPDADGDAADKSFTITLIRLREILGYKNSIELTDRKLTLNQNICWVDIWAFERQITEINQDIEKIEKAINIYKGIFLKEDIDEIWAIEMREKLCEKYLKCIDTLGKYYEKEKNYSKAIEYYKKGIEADELAEKIYYNLMKCHKNSNQRVEAIGIYKKCEEKLLARLNIEPSAEMKKMYEEIL